MPPKTKVVPRICRHYKGQDYEVLDVARHTETDEDFVVYRVLYGAYRLWIRPLTMVVESVTVEHEAYHASASPAASATRGTGGVRLSEFQVSRRGGDQADLRRSGEEARIMITKLGSRRAKTVARPVERRVARRSVGLAFTRRTQRLIGRALLALGVLVMVAALSQSVDAASEDQTKFKRIPTQFIAALGEPGATSGSGAESWGLWHLDPGPRGVWLKNYAQLQAAGAVAPAQWKFDSMDWWLDENGLIMEKPVFPVPPGKYVVTGDREMITVLTVHPADKDGERHWELAEGATLYDVTHLPCRSARYTPATSESGCSPAQAQQTAFPVTPGGPMPPVEGCNKQDYAVLFVIGVAVEN